MKLDNMLNQKQQEINEYTENSLRIEVPREEVGLKGGDLFVNKSKNFPKFAV